MMTPETMNERFEMRLSQSVLDRVDGWRVQQDDLPSRSEAIRRLVEEGLTAPERKKQLRIGDGNKLIIIMLCQLFKKLNLDTEIDPEFVESAIHGGHYWGLEWQYSGIFHGHEDAESTVSEVVDILDMWYFVERGFAALSTKDKELVASKSPLGKHVKFSGFDGNHEGEYIGVARFLIEKLDRFTEFRKRGLDAHMPTIEAHRRMLAVFDPIRKNLVGRDLSAEEIIDILNARVHPSQRVTKGKSL
jgi:uncharacterized protein